MTRLIRGWAPRIATMIAIMVYGLGLQFSYVNHLVPVVGRGYLNFEPPAILILISLLVAVLPVLWLPIISRRVSSIVLWLLYLVVFVPSCVIPAYSTPDPMGGYHLYVLVLLVCTIVGTLFCRVRYAPGFLSVLAKDSAASTAIIVALALIGSGFIVITHGINWELFSNLDSLYDVRDDKSDLWEANVIAAYAPSILGYSILPFLIAWSLIRKQRFVLVAAIVCQLLIYAASAQKSFGYMAIVVSAMYFATRGGTARLIRLVPIVLAIFVWIVNWYASLSGEYVPSIMLIQRPFVVPGLLSPAYYDFFSKNEFIYLSQGPLKWLFDYPYPTSHALIVGSVYFESDDSWANANFWADGFAQAGFAGMITATVLLGTIFVLLDFLAKRHGPQLVFLSMLGPLVSLANTGLTTTLLTGGLAPLLLVLLVTPVYKALPSRGRRRDDDQRTLVQTQMRTRHAH